jgi:hypothetical protein
MWPWRVSDEMTTRAVMSHRLAKAYNNGTPTKCHVSKRQVSKRSVSKRQVYKTSGLKNVRFTKLQVSKRLVSKRPVFKFDILIQQKV